MGIEFKLCELDTIILQALDCAKKAGIPVIPQDVLVALGAKSEDKKRRVRSRLDALYEAGYIELRIENFRVASLQARDGWDCWYSCWETSGC